MEVILRDFHQKINQEDIVIRFYEDFLAAYKPKMRERRGVYYTPQPVVSYIVRSVDHILKQDFGLQDGLADATKVRVKSADGKKTTETHKVLITDPAVGTGTFLHEVINHIHRSFESKPEQWSDYVAQNLLPRLLGFELLMAPYAVAHMKLGLQLAELGYKFDTEERLRVYLTNTLQEAFRIPPAEEHFSNLFWGEADAANRIKEIAPVMVILGNPPYSGHSANNGDWIKNLLKGKDSLTEQLCSNYFEVDGKPLGERNPKWLNDDYVKFIRFGQWRIERTGYGVLAFVTNHGYLDNPTFRGMRQSLMKTFDDIYVLDLHGNSKKKESCPDGSKDENVFDIQQGVSINIFVKHPNGNKEKASVHHADLWGDRDYKYSWLKENDITTTQWTTLKPQSSFYLFVPQDNDLRAEYEQGWKITNIFPVNNTGIISKRDKLAFHFDKESVKKIVKDIFDLSESQIIQKYPLSSWKSRDGKVEYVKNSIVRNGLDDSKFIQILYRPFDKRWTYYTSMSKGFVAWPVYKVMQHMLAGKNLGLISARSNKSSHPDHFFCSNFITETKCGESTTQSCLFPLYLYPETNISQPSVFEKEQRNPNFSQGFLDDINLKLGYLPTPEAIFYYIYAILHSPTYRDRYAEFLKGDFARIPITHNVDLFSQLGELGEQLVNLHLMKSPILNQISSPYIDNGGGCIVDAGHPKYEDSKVIINKQKDGFVDVSEAVWNFHVGGYQVCHKWLKDRKGRTLSQDDIGHYQKVVVSLKETIKLMTKIDQAIPSFPIQ
jgi:predicted helicase